MPRGYHLSHIFPYPTARRFAAPLYKFVFFLLGHFRPRRFVSLSLQISPAIHSFLSSLPPCCESCAIVDATSSLDKA